MSESNDTRPGLHAGGVLLRALPGISPAFIIVALLACILVPLPTPLVDLLLSVSLAVAVLLLVVALGVRRTTDFLGFPQLLLLATLFRLALNVSTTRLILSQADAGEVVDAFAGFVVRDDLVVGGVMFAIITIVQYVVIARGAERVAEVGARFALDGLPGSQAAIDADLRAGVLSPREAAAKRARLSERSSFYGAMDGAIRFVKGDAIAGLAITAVNLLAGLAIGMGRLGYGLGESLDVYARLTIGDGLLAQIPALLVSLAAGILVSRVDSDRARGGLPRWLDPAMLLVPAAMLLVLAVVPRMPAMAFVTTAVALVTTALFLAGRRAAAASRRPRPRARAIDVRLRSVPGGDERGLADALGALRRECEATLGVDVPPIVHRIDPSLADGELRVDFDGRSLSRETDSAGHDVVVRTFRALMRNADALLDLETLDAELQRARSVRPVATAEALSRLSVPQLLSALRELMRERVTLPPIEVVLSAVAEEPLLKVDSEKSRAAELLRTALSRYWVRSMLDAVSPHGPPRVLRLDPELEADLRGAFSMGEGGRSLRLSPAHKAGLIAQARAHADDKSFLVVVATPTARAAAAQVFVGASPFIAVLSTAELAGAGIELEPFAYLDPA